MASEEHKSLANFIKNVHSELRKETAEKDFSKAWKEHCSKTDVLNEYAACMKKLANIYWKENSTDPKKTASSRVEWVANICHEYFHNSFLNYRQKEIDIAVKTNQEVLLGDSEILSVTDRIKLLDVGSCYNPFKDYNFIDVMAIDLCPADDSVYKCDFLNVIIGEGTFLENNDVYEFKRSYFDALTFCFVLEYIPSSEQRIKACEKAYNLLKPEGLLVVTTPDSKHVGANSKIMKCWRYALALMGFSRIRYEKFSHMHCMAFRKSLSKDIASRWAKIHQEPYMKFQLNIPQDFASVNVQDKMPKSQDDECSHVENFKQLPLAI